MTGSETYSLRDVVIKNAMVFQQDETIEIITAMRPSRLIDSANSSWFDFSIMALNGATWVQHFVCQGKAGEEFEASGKNIAKHPRRLAEDFWYERMRRLGLNYGPQFQGLKEISAHTKERRATAAVLNEAKPGSWYAVHPTTLDACLQLFTVAMTNGLARRLETLAVPASVGYICVKPGASSLTVEAFCEVDDRGTIHGDFIALTPENQTVVNLKNGTFAPLENEDLFDGKDPAAAVRLQWRPDVGFLEPSTLMRRELARRDRKIVLEKITAVCILRMSKALEKLEIPAGHLAKYASWLQKEKRCHNSG